MTAWERSRGTPQCAEQRPFNLPNPESAGKISDRSSPGYFTLFVRIFFHRAQRWNLKPSATGSSEESQKALGSRLTGSDNSTAVGRGSPSFGGRRLCGRAGLAGELPPQNKFWPRLGETGLPPVGRARKCCCDYAARQATHRRYMVLSSPFRSLVLEAVLTVIGGESA